MIAHPHDLAGVQLSGWARAPPPPSRKPSKDKASQTGRSHQQKVQKCPGIYPLVALSARSHSTLLSGTGFYLLFVLIFNCIYGAREMIRWLRAHAALAEGLSLGLSTSITAYSCPELQPREPSVLFGPPKARHQHSVNTYVQVKQS